MKKHVVLYLMFLFFLGHIFAQELTPAYSLVDMPGDNVEMDLLSVNPYDNALESTKISWINISDSIYTVYFAEMDSLIRHVVSVQSDSIQKTNSRISFINEEKFRIIWQEKGEHFWRIVYRDYFLNDSLDEKHVLIDSLNNNPQFVVDSEIYVWIDDGNLLYQTFNSSMANPVLVDSNFCSNPDILNSFYAYLNTAILYEKEIDSNHQVFIAQKIRQKSQTWEIIQITEEGDNINPVFSDNGAYAFQNRETDIWNIDYSVFYYGTSINRTQNTLVNYENPAIFTYDIFTKTENTPFFIVFDSDSIADNREIFLIPISYSYIEYSIKNISDSEGDDYCPKITYLKYDDQIDLAIVWNKEMDGKTEIWMSRTPFNPETGVIDEGLKQLNFTLDQNYPNPFNPSTTIEYDIKKPGKVDLKIYDIKGEEVFTLFKGHLNIGHYRAQFDATDLASGVYFYRLNVDGEMLTKKMLLIR